MTTSPPANLVASVRQRLLTLSRDRGEDFQLTLTRYAIERLLYRLTQSGHAEQFVLKGALLVVLWTGQLSRPTRDLDLLVYGSRSEDAWVEVFKDVCTADVEADGLVFDPTSIRVTEIRDDQEYQGQRVQMVVMLGKARIVLQVDIGFGDVVTPVVEEVEYPHLV